MPQALDQAPDVVPEREDHQEHDQHQAHHGQLLAEFERQWPAADRLGELPTFCFEIPRSGVQLYFATTLPDAM